MVGVDYIFYYTHFTDIRNFDVESQFSKKETDALASGAGFT